MFAVKVDPSNAFPFITTLPLGVELTFVTVAEPVLAISSTAEVSSRNEYLTATEAVSYTHLTLPTILRV